MADLKHETEIQDAPPSLIEGGKQGASPSGSGHPSSTEPASGLCPPGGSPSRMQWQPIATAPRDGRLIIVYHAERGVEVTGADGDWWNSTTARGLRAIPSRWMPLPPAPCDGSGASRQDPKGLDPKDDSAVGEASSEVEAPDLLAELEDAASILRGNDAPYCAIAVESAAEMLEKQALEIKYLSTALAESERRAKVADAALDATWREVVAYPFSQVCKHLIASNILSRMEELGFAVTKEIAEAVVRCRDEEALAYPPIYRLAPTQETSHVNG